MANLQQGYLDASSHLMHPSVIKSGKPAATASDASGATVHTGVQCDVCKQAPITGVRYKSYQTPNYDVCAKCKQLPDAWQHAPFRAMGSKGRTVAAAAGTAAATVRGAGSSRQPGIQQFLGSAANGSSSAGQQQPRPTSTGSGTGSSNVAAAIAAAPPVRQATPERPGAERHRKLAEWIWAYFSSGDATPEQQQQQQMPPGWSSLQDPEAAAARAAASASAARGDSMTKLPRRNSPVVLTSKAPLYLQHEGHSRTVVGIERCLPRQAAARGDTAAAEYSLVVLDPGISAQELINSLRSKQGWQRHLKRGLSSLARNPEYQVLYIGPGIVPQGPARDSLKRVSAEKRFEG